MIYTKENPLKVVTTFSGYDSQCLALRRAGIPFDLIGWSEIDKYAIQAHNILFPEFEDRFLGDVTKIDWSVLPDFDFLTYSSPCQDISNAGLQRGLTKDSGTRSSLLWEIEKAVQIKRPKFLMMENVKAIVSDKFISDFNHWIATLASYGYDSQWQILNATGFNVPQNRERCFLISKLDDEPFYFPEEKPLQKKLADILEEDVDEKFFLDDSFLDRLEFLKDEKTDTD